MLLTGCGDPGREGAPQFARGHFALTELDERYIWDNVQIEGLLAVTPEG